MMNEILKRKSGNRSLSQISEKDVEREMKEIFRKDNLFLKIKKIFIKDVNYIENKGINFKYFLIFLSLIALLIMFSIPIIPETVLEVYDKEVFNEKVDIIDTIPKRISFGEFMLNMEDYNKQIVNITGHLRRYKATMDNGIVIYEVLSDDLGNEIDLKGLGDYNIFMPELGETTDAFIVTGKFERNYNRPILHVHSIIPTQMEYINITIGTKIIPKEKVIRREVVEPRRSIMKLFLGMI